MIRQPCSKDEPIIIVGAGVFGLSTALELTKRGYSSVTVLDRYLPPVPDGSSVDISRVIRVEYADAVYSKMAIESRDGWRGKYNEHYHEAGMVLLFPDTHPYAQKSLEIGEASGERLTKHDSVATLMEEFPGSFQANAPGMRGLTNRSGGWADAAGAIRQLASECTAAGVSFITGSRGRVVSLRYSGDRITGANVAEGDAIPASQVILSAGAWSNTLIHMTQASTASGQPVGFVQLTPSEAKRMEKMPVILNLVTGVFVFPPTPDSHILKIARHGHGYATERVTQNATVSAPRSDGNNAQTGFIPDDADAALRSGLRQLVPEFGERPWINRRLCWYSDTPEGDFIIDHHPNIDGLFLATGGAGHAFKFLPVLGRYISDCFENKASEALRYKWRFRLPSTSGDGNKPGDGSRGGPPLRVLSKAEQAKL